jgi:hypothetical protein
VAEAHLWLDEARRAAEAEAASRTTRSAAAILAAASQPQANCVAATVTSRGLRPRWDGVGAAALKVGRLAADG